MRCRPKTASYGAYGAFEEALSFTGVSVGSRQDCEDMFAVIAHHKLRPVVGAIFPLAEAREAFAFLKSGAHFGKVVVALNSTIGCKWRPGLTSTWIPYARFLLFTSLEA